MEKELLRFLDDDLRVTMLPRKSRKVVLGYLAGKFELNRHYSEKEVNKIIDQWHTFGDYFMLRRALVDDGFLLRTGDGLMYWREEASLENNL